MLEAKVRQRCSKQRQHPFKLLVLCLWGTYDSVTWVAPRRCRVRLTPMADRMHVSNHKLREYFGDLQRMGYVRGLTLEPGYATVTLNLPPLQRLGLQESPDASAL